MAPSTLCVVQANCPRCGAALAADAVECPTCAYADVEEIAVLEAQPPGEIRRATPEPSSVPRVLAGLAILVVVVAAIFAALR